MNKVVIIFALLLAVTMANPQFFGGGFNRRPLFGGGFGGFGNQNRFGPGVVGLRPIGQGFPGQGFPGQGFNGGSGTGAGAGTGNAGPGGVSASGVGISSAQNGGFGVGTGSGSAGTNFFTGQSFATGDGSGQSFGK